MIGEEPVLITNSAGVTAIPVKIRIMYHQWSVSVVTEGHSRCLYIMEWRPELLVAIIIISMQRQGNNMQSLINVNPAYYT